MEHLHFWPGIFIPSDAGLVKAAGLYNSIHSVNNVPIIGKLAPSERVLREEKLLNCCVQLIPRVMLAQQVSPLRNPREDSRGMASLKAVRSAIQGGGIPDNISKHVGNVAKDIDGIMGALYRKTRRQFMKISKKRIHAFRFAFMAEQAPDPGSRLTLSDERDGLGVKRLRLNWRIGEADILSTVRVQKVIAGELQRAGLGMFYPAMNDGTPPPDLHGGYHHMGTTRMHNDPKQGVVDEHCKVHGISNLFIAGPSVFPTGGYANPVLTLVALSVKLSDHVKELMNQGEGN
jgi:choline dehydrogenase-like flavoprotein